MAYVLCRECKGRKKISSLGFMEQDCNYCKGVGFVEMIGAKTTIIPTVTDPNTQQEVVIRKKPGRKTDAERKLILRNLKKKKSFLKTAIKGDEIGAVEPVQNEVIG